MKKSVMRFLGWWANLSPSQQRRIKSKFQIESFKKWYLPHWFKLSGCEMHRVLDKLVFEIANRNVARKVAVGAPRGSAKSTELAFLLPMYCICHGLKKNIAIIGDTATQAQEHIESIRRELESNKMIAEDFPHVSGIGSTWTNTDIVTRNGIRVRAFGRGGAIRGTKKGEERPDLIIGDDLDNDESVVTPEQREKTESWWFKAVSQAGYAKRTSIIVIGTVMHYDCLLAKLLKHPGYEGLLYRSVTKWSESPKWETWRDIYTDKINGGKDKAKTFYIEHEQEMVSGTAVLWQENESYYDLMEIKLSGEASFNSEKQNEPIDPKDCRFQDMQFYDSLPEKLEYYGACDPGMGKDAGDYTAIIVIGKDEHGYIYIIDAIVERIKPGDAIQRIINLPYEFQRFGVEDVAFQEFFRQQMTEESRKLGKYMPIIGIKNEGTKKELRIDSLQPHIANGTIKFNRRHYRLLEQLRYYPMADHDDGPDCLEMAFRLVKKGHLIFQGE